MKSFEQLLGLETDEQRAEFHGDCQDVFRTPAGRRIMARLVAARHPMAFPQGHRVEHTMVANGQREVVACLFRFSQPAITL
jgi:hypothetical protein